MWWYIILCVPLLVQEQGHVVADTVCGKHDGTAKYPLLYLRMCAYLAISTSRSYIYHLVHYSVAVKCFHMTD